MSVALLQDHFRPPLSARRHWHAFHNAWATYLASDLNAHLPEGYFADPNVQFGLKIDVAAFEERGFGTGEQSSSAVWAPPAPIQTVPFALATDAVEVLVYDSREGPTLAGAIELVSPSNKDRPEHREPFVSKCETYLQGGAGLVVVDVVTERTANLHDELLRRLAPSQPPAITASLYASAYRPVEKDGQPTVEIWAEPLEVGRPLPLMPLWLRGGLCLRIDLPSTYDRTCAELRVPAARRGGARRGPHTVAFPSRFSASSASLR